MVVRVLPAWISRSFYNSRWQGRGEKPCSYIHIPGSTVLPHLLCDGVSRKLRLLGPFIWSSGVIALAGFRTLRFFFLFFIGSVLRRHVELRPFIFVMLHRDCILGYLHFFFYTWGKWYSVTVENTDLHYRIFSPRLFLVIEILLKECHTGKEGFSPILHLLDRLCNCLVLQCKSLCYRVGWEVLSLLNFWKHGGPNTYLS